MKMLLSNKVNQKQDHTGRVSEIFHRQNCEEFGVSLSLYIITLINSYKSLGEGWGL